MNAGARFDNEHGATGGIPVGPGVLPVSPGVVDRDGRLINTAGSLLERATTFYDIDLVELN